MQPEIKVSRDIKTDYDAFYAEGGWPQDLQSEIEFIRKRIVDPLALKPGSTVLELGCGMGLQSAVWHGLGFSVTALDRSSTGITHAKNTYEGPTYHCMDVGKIFNKFEPESFDIVYVRGMSWYHYELNEVNKLGIDVPKFTEKVFGLLKKGGTFILQIKTDFTGRRPAEGVYHCKVVEFRQLFERFGEIKLLSDWHGTILASNEDGERSGERIIIGTQK